MTTFTSMTHQLDTRMILRVLLLLGTITACMLVLVVLLCALWLVQETFRAIAEIVQLLSVANPLVITGLIVLVGVVLIGNVRK